MRRWLSVSLGVMMALAAVSAAAASGAGLGDLLPGSRAVAGWTRQGPPRSYTADTLFEYINGAADLFVAYGFEGLAAATYEQGDEHLMTVDVYDMGAPLQAFGVFATERPAEPEETLVGVDGYASDGLVAFWKGRHYVKISVVDVEDTAAACAMAWATADRLPGPGTLPMEFSRLPAARRIGGSERYVRKDALGHRFLVNVVSADYRVGDVIATVRVADLGTPEQAAQGWEKLRAFEERAGEGLTDVPALGARWFAARDAGYGEVVAGHTCRFLVMAMSEKASRDQLAELCRETLAALKGK